MKRQQKIYRLYRVQKFDSRLKLINIYKERVFKYYDHDFYDDHAERFQRQRQGGTSRYGQG